MSTLVRFSVLLLSLGIAFPAQAEIITFKKQWGPVEPKIELGTSLIQNNEGVKPIAIHLSIPAIDATKDKDGFVQVRAEGLVPMAFDGSPDLGTTGVLVAVPDGYEPKLTEVRKEQQHVAGMVVAPFQQRSRCAAGKQLGSFSFNHFLYQSDLTFPLSVVETEEVGRLGNLRLMRVGLHPLQMNFEDKSLLVTTDLDLQVTFEATGLPKTTTLPRTLFQLASHIVANGTGLSGAVRPSGNQEVMVIIAADTLKDKIQKLVSWEKAKGIAVRVFTTSEAGGTNTAIKAFLQAFYDKSVTKPTYLLMVGNETTVPPFRQKVTFRNQIAVTDYPYSLLSGNDAIPDLLYGRILANNEKELATQVERWIHYEKAPDKGGKWYTEGLTIASREGGSPSDKGYAEGIQGTLKKGGYTKVDGFYEEDDTATAANVVDSLKQGRSWVTYFGHGNGKSWASMNDDFSVDDIQKLENDHLPVVIDVACQNANYVRFQPCFGKAWVTQTGPEGRAAGAVAYYGGSVSITWHPPAIMASGIAKYHFEKPVRTLGGSLLAGQLYLIEKMGVGNEAKDNLTWFNLFGDPSLQLRTASPRPFTVSLNRKANGASTEIALVAKDSAGNTVRGLKATLSSALDTDPLAVQFTDKMGNANLTWNGHHEDLHLTVTGYNAETYEETLSAR